ncbi:MAG: ATP-binding protein [Myxococcales bacterium]|nr:ATP-binding protein [Myxococcales bacterium]
MSEDDRRKRMRTPASVQWTEGRKAPNPPQGQPRRVPEQVQQAQARAVASVSMKRGRPVLPSEQAASRAFRQQPSPRQRREFFPLEPRSWEESGIDVSAAETLVLRTLLGSGAETGRSLADRVRLDLGLIQDVLDKLKDKKLVNYRGTTVMGDFVTELTEEGQNKAIESRKLTAYVGPAPVPWNHYQEALRYQALSAVSPGIEDLQRAFADLSVNEDLFDRLGPAVTSGRALFLHGEPGNGKTSLAERMTRCFGGSVWIPYTIEIGGHYVKLFDPAIHRELEVDPQLRSRYDRRWARIERPTVIAGGELTLDMLEIKHDPVNNVCESPLHLKANMGTFVVDDFGRGNTSPRDLLNRWIFPLEKRRDFLSLPDGRKFTAPFDCLLVFSTNLEPRDLADEAFLRRIPYKIYVGDPLEDEFEALVETVAAKMGVTLQNRSVRYLIDRHYKMQDRPMRMCHPRDLLMQVVHLCEYERRPLTAGPAEWDRVIANYFGSY